MQSYECGICGAGCKSGVSGTVSRMKKKMEQEIVVGFAYVNATPYLRVLMESVR
jgi:hypothetical protein